MTMSTVVSINYLHPSATAANSNQLEDFRVSAFGSLHTGGANFCMGDGSVRFIAENVAMPVFRSVGTRAGGEVVDDF